MADQENDEDIWDSWEDMAESGELERRMEEREREHMKLRDEIDKKLFEPGVRVLVDTDSNRTKYSPQVRILRRDPGDAAQMSGNNESDTNRKVHKTLAQREKEYADARARILGETAENSADETCPPTKVNTEEKLPDNIIRQPRFLSGYRRTLGTVDKQGVAFRTIQTGGPDGTQGFALKR